MEPTLKKKIVLTKHASRHQKAARLHSGNTIVAKRYIRTLDASIMLKGKQNGTKKVKSN